MPTQSICAAGHGDSALSQLSHFSISKAVLFDFKRLDLAETRGQLSGSQRGSLILTVWPLASNLHVDDSSLLGMLETDYTCPVLESSRHGLT